VEVGKMIDEVIKCPRCEKNMKKITRHGVTIDVCKKCHGMWLDDGEIDKLIMIGKSGVKE
jgi:Zn-finger nucleic acid-binding protein